MSLDKNSRYHPHFYLGDTFVDSKKRVFEIVETHWGELKENQILSYSIDLVNGHKIIINGTSESELTMIGFKEMKDVQTDVIKLSVTEALRLMRERKIVML